MAIVSVTILILAVLIYLCLFRPHKRSAITEQEQDPAKLWMEAWDAGSEKARIEEEMHQECERGKNRSYIRLKYLRGEWVTLPAPKPPMLEETKQLKARN